MLAVETHNGALKIEGGVYMKAPRSYAGAKPDLGAVSFPVGTTHVFVDEVQFYDCADVRAIILDKWVRQAGLVVHCVGLLTDKEKEMWPVTRLLLCHADKISFLHSKCSCGMAAGHTRATSATAAAAGQVYVGGMKEYAAACIHCHPTH